MVLWTAMNSRSASGESRWTAAPYKTPTVSHHSAGRLSINVYKHCRRSFTSPNGVSLPLYTPEQRRRRDESGWTTVQGVLAPLQFVVFLVSLVLVIRFLATGDGFAAATLSIVIKTLVLYAIMVTGSIWEREVFGVYLFARPFFWEDVFSILVLALHTAYLAVLATGALDPQGQMLLALAAYAAYVVNAAQFLLKLRAARREHPVARDSDLEAVR
jgi:3-vinyl bacteriochlorophyllide hydratase